MNSEQLKNIIEAALMTSQGTMSLLNLLTTNCLADTFPIEAGAKYPEMKNRVNIINKSRYMPISPRLSIRSESTTIHADSNEDRYTNPEWYSITRNIINVLRLSR